MKNKIEIAIEEMVKKQPYLSAMVYSLKLVETDEVPTAGTDGEFLFWNKKFINSLKSGQVAAVVFHEVLHCALEHIWRKEKRDHMTFNMACDYAVNPLVSDIFPLPDGGLIDSKYYGMSAEEIYEKLPKPPKQPKNSGNKKNNQNNSTQKQNNQQPWGDHKFWGEDGKKEKEKILKKANIIDKITGKNKLLKSTETESEKQAKWKKLFNDSFVKNFGSLPLNIRRTVEQSYNVPVLNWAELIQNLLSADESDYNFSRPDRRFGESEFIIPGLYSQEKLQDVVFAYDTSGSISRDDLRDFYSETLNLFNNFSNIHGHIAVCDASIHDFFEINIDKPFNELSLRGGGGTDFRPVFNEIEKRNLNPKALFYFTDTEGYFPKKEPDFPVFWLVKSSMYQKNIYNSYRNNSIPFGKVITFMPRKAGI